jgi:flavodoxin
MKNMKTLVVYYSRTGRTKRIAEEIAKKLSADIEEIIDIKQRFGPIGFIDGGRQAKKKELTEIKTCSKEPSQYDVVIIGTPIWYFTMATAIRTYLHQQKDLLPKVALFCTYGGIGVERTFSDMEELCGKKPVSILGVTTMELIRGTYSESMNRFLNEIAEEK